MSKGTLLKSLALLAALALVFLLSLSFGSAGFVLKGILSGDESVRTIVFALRLPRVLAAMLSGLAFALSGLLLQASTGNELASPSVIGVNSGAGFAVLLFLSFFPMHFKLLPIASFLGALSASLLVLFITRSISAIEDKSTLILSGIAVSSFFSAGISLISALDPDVLATYSSFSIGGFSGVFLSDLASPAIVIGLSMLVMFFFLPSLSLMGLGDEMASSYGVNISRTRMGCIILSSALSAAAVSFSGLLGFVGLIVPHMARFLYGEGLFRRVLGAVLLGPILVSLADLVGRTIAPPAEIPGGVFMAALGVPFFFMLLYRRKRRLA